MNTSLLQRLVYSLLLLLTSATTIQAACIDVPGNEISRNDVLIIVNQNSPDSKAIGDYYCEKRQLDASDILSVSTPTSYFIEWDQFIILRDQIIKFMQDNTLPDGMAPISCTETPSNYYCEASIEQIRNHSRIRYLVTTRDMPNRLFVEGSHSSPTSLDNFLKYWLVNYFDGPTSSFSASNNRTTVFADGRGMREIQPEHDHELIIGRIDGLTVGGAKGLIDRTLAAETNGFYGKLYGSQYGKYNGKARWWNHITREDVYGDSNINGDFTAWRYQHGLFGDWSDGIHSGIRYTTDMNCTDHLNFSASQAQGKSPQDCVVKLTEGSSQKPATANSRQPLADAAAVYLGSLDGQPTSGSFNNFLNWRKNASCTVTLCDDHEDPALCRAQSIDPHKEINTQCVGFAEGFFGYNYQSYPVSFFTSWPTAWYQSTSNNVEVWGHQGGGDFGYMAFPTVVENEGFDDNYSLWFFNAPKTGERCFNESSDIGSTPQSACYSERRVNINQRVTIPEEAISSTPQSYQLNFKYKILNLNKNIQLRVRLMINESVYDDGTTIIPNNNQVIYPYQSITLTPDSSSEWQDASFTLTLDPSLHQHPDLLYKGVKIRIETNTRFEGQLGFDQVSLIKLGEENNQLLVNSSFTEGHQEVAAGDHAAMFVGRSNGVGFWGSVSHQYTGGHNFAEHPMEALIYFMRGLPLGDAVWYGAQRPSGLFIGDPLYSPIAVHIDYVSNDQDYMHTTSPYTLTGSALNGRGENVDTTYNISYCSGHDFYECDLSDSWTDMGLSGTGGFRNGTFGQFTSSDFGEKVIRLSVTSTNQLTSHSQTFYDYYPVTFYDGDADNDEDGLSNRAEIETYGTSIDNSDTDSDGLSDSEEVHTHGTSPLEFDSDEDGLRDGEEVELGTNPLNKDTDGDGFEDGAEVAIGMDPLIPDEDANKWIGTVTGRIVNENGQGIAGVTFWDVFRFPDTITTDEKGYFVAKDYQSGDNIWFNVNATSSGYSLSPMGWNASQPFVHDGGAVVAKNYLAIQDNTTVSGRVRLENGEPLSDVTFWDVFHYPETVTTSANGQFVSQGYQSGDYYWFNTFSTNSGYTLVPDNWDGQVKLHDGTAQTSHNYIATQNPGTVSGRITTPNGKPLAGLTFWDVTRYPETVTTNADGRFILQGYKAGDQIWFNTHNTGYNLVPANWNGAAFTHDGSAMTMKDYVAKPTDTASVGTVSGRIITEDGTGVAGITFWDVFKTSSPITTDANGYFIAKGYASGDSVWFNVFATNSGYTLTPIGWNASQPFAHDGGAVVARNYLATANSDTVRGKVHLSNGEPLAGITFWDVFHYPETVTTKTNGEFVSHPYNADDYFWFNVFSTNSGYSLKPDGWDGQYRQHEGSAYSGINYVATQNPGTVSGRVTTPDGKPITGVTFWDVSRYPDTITTGEDGRFILQNYEAGDYIWFNTATSGYSMTPANWDGGLFQHDGSAIIQKDFIAIPSQE